MTEKEIYQRAEQQRLRAQILEPACLGLNPSCVSFSFLICKMGIIISPALQKFWRKLNELIYVRHLEWCMKHRVLALI